MIIEFLSIKKPLLNAKPKLFVVNEEAGFKKYSEFDANCG